MRTVKSGHRHVLSLPVVLALAACGSAPVDNFSGGGSTPGPRHTVAYHTGPIIPNVHVIQVLYGSGTYLPEVTSSMRQFYGDVTNSAYLDWLTEYDLTGTAPQSIGRGNVAGAAITITPSAANSGATITSNQVKLELAAQVNAKALPAPNGNTLFMVHFPRGVTITNGTLRSCDPNFTNQPGIVYYCGYHDSTTDAAGDPLYFAVLPDFGPGSGCDYATTPSAHTPCGTNPANFDNLTAIASHELLESITDPNLNAWFEDFTGQEIADICERQYATVNDPSGTWRVQLAWSNAQQACVSKPAQGDGAAFISQSVPPQVNAGAKFNASLTFQNTGATTWTNAANYRLGSQSPKDNLIWGIDRMTLTATDAIAAGKSKTFSAALTAPATPGTYAFQWEMLRENVASFGDLSTVQNIKVIPAAANLPTVNWTFKGATEGNQAAITWSSGSAVGYVSKNATRCDLTKYIQQGTFGPYQYIVAESDPNHGLSDANVTVLTTPNIYRYDVTCSDQYGDKQTASLYITVPSGGGGCSGVCKPGQTQACGNCGTQTCTSDCAWGACSNQGACMPGASASCCPCSSGCGCGGSMVCDGSCNWGFCQGYICKPGVCR